MNHSNGGLGAAVCHWDRAALRGCAAPMLAHVLCHLYQGPLGVTWVAAFGVTITLAYVITRQLWPSVLAHILWDIVPLL